MRPSCKVLFAFELAVLCELAYACSGEPEHAHEHQRRIYSQQPPSHPLVWSDINVIHTTDTHGWLSGHQKDVQPESNYNGNFGELASFVSHMKQIALEKDVDLLFVDSGDLHDGTGLSDGYPSGGVDGHESDKFFLDMPYDLMTVGNHELYIYAVAEDVYKNIVPRMNGRYLASNVNITILDEQGVNVSVPLGARYAKFKTRKGRRVTSLGVMFDFTGNSANTTVQPVQDMVNEQWFKDAIAEEPDLFLLVGHMPVSNDHWPDVFDAVRAVHNNTPILIFGGHTHIRDCRQYDGRSMALESGRYMETIGWMSANLSGGDNENITFSRRYLDQNRVTYEYHTKTSNSSFDTKEGLSITSGLFRLAEDFDLNDQYGTSPQDFTLTATYPSNNSIYALLGFKAFPYAISVNNTRTSQIPPLGVVNSGQIRYAMFAGSFTKNDAITAAPFSNTISYIPNISLSIANQVVPALNGNGSNSRRSMERETERYSQGDVSMRFQEWLEEMNARASMSQKRDAQNLTLGYVTNDGCPGVGDDTPHIAVAPDTTPPTYLASDSPDVPEDTPIDLVFVDFFAADVLTVLNSLQSDKTYTTDDVASYTPVIMNEVMALYAQATWN